MKKYVSLYYLSIGILIFDVFYFVYFIVRQTPKHLLICVLLILAFSVLFAFSSKKCRYADGYNIIQAGFYYRLCRKNGIKNLKDFYANSDKAAELSKHYESSKNLDETKLAKMFAKGKDYVEKKIVANQ